MVLDGDCTLVRAKSKGKSHKPLSKMHVIGFGFGCTMGVHLVTMLGTNSSELGDDNRQRAFLIYLFNFYFFPFLGNTGQSTSTITTKPAAPERCTLSATMAPPKPRRASLKTQYLILYNLNSAVLWFVILGRVVSGVPQHGFGGTYEAVGNFAKLTQTAAVLEIIHAAIGKNPP